MQLHFQIFPETASLPLPGEPLPALIIPGLFGLTANWRSFAKKLSSQLPVIIVDQRNHGRSPHATTNSYTDLVRDLAHFLERHQIERVNLIGHSMGGKVAMAFALMHPESVGRLAVLDIAPVKYSHNPAPFLPELLQVDVGGLASRAEVERLLRPVISDTATRLFLLQSLAGSKGHYHWRLNLPVLQEYMPQIVGFPDGLVAGRSYDRPVLFVHGSLSDYVRPAHYDKIAEYFPHAEYSQIAGAGHWLHVEQPELVLESLNKYLKE